MKHLFSFPWGDVVIQYISSQTVAQNCVQPDGTKPVKKRRSEKQRAVSREFFSRAEARLNREKMLEAICKDWPPEGSPRGVK